MPSDSDAMKTELEYTLDMVDAFLTHTLPNEPDTSGLYVHSAAPDVIAGMLKSDRTRLVTEAMNQLRKRGVVKARSAGLFDVFFKSPEQRELDKQQKRLDSLAEDLEDQLGGGSFKVEVQDDLQKLRREQADLLAQEADIARQRADMLQTFMQQQGLVTGRTSMGHVARELREIARELARTAERPLPTNAPDEVREVYEAMVESAKRAAEMVVEETGETGPEAESTRKFWQNRPYAHTDTRNGREAWVLTDNFEEGPNLVHYPDTGEWAYMEQYGEEHPYDFRRALADARIYYTG